MFALSDRVRPGRDRELDFIVIGVQKGGTTSLWQYLRRHASIAMPDHKEAPIFCAGESEYRDLLAWLMRTNFDDVPADVRLGKVATYYMMGKDAVDVERVAARIAESLPRVRLIALLRDPISRAMSQYRMSVRRGFESRPFDAAVEELLEPEALRMGRLQPTETNSYLTQGEYGRILQAYAARFPGEQIHIEWTADLADDPGSVLDRVLAFVGLPPGYRPEGLGVRHHRGGTSSRIDEGAKAQLEDFMAEAIWPRLGEAAGRAQRAFDFFLRTWNVIPDEELPGLSVELRARLQDHYRRDAELLLPLSGPPPWLTAWSARI